MTSQSELVLLVALFHLGAVSHGVAQMLLTVPLARAAVAPETGHSLGHDAGSTSVGTLGQVVRRSRGGAFSRTALLASYLNPS
jgi:hypothetical protein